MSAPFGRQALSAPRMLHTARALFAKIPDEATADIPLVDHLMSGLTLFGLKYPSLLQFDQDREDETKRANLRTLYGIERAPSDTWFRQRLDVVDPKYLRPLYKALFAGNRCVSGVLARSHIMQSL